MFVFALSTVELYSIMQSDSRGCYIFCYIKATSPESERDRLEREIQGPVHGPHYVKYVLIAIYIVGQGDKSKKVKLQLQ